MTLFVISPWLGLMWQHYGNFFINTPHDPGNPWYHYVFGRPLYAYPLDMFWFVPATLIGWGYGLFAWRHPQRQWKEAALLATSLFYLFMFMVFMKTGTAGVEDRYLLPIYPPLAILAACGLVRVGQFLPKTWAKETAYVIVFLLLGGLGWSSALTGLHISFSSLAVFKPFDF